MFKSRREELHLTQSDVAQKLGITTAQYCRLESGQRRLWFEQFVELAKILGFSDDDIIQCVREPASPTKQAA